MAKDREGAPKLARPPKKPVQKAGVGVVSGIQAPIHSHSHRVSPVAEWFLGRDTWIIPFFRALSAPFVN